MQRQLALVIAACLVVGCQNNSGPAANGDREKLMTTLTVSTMEDGIETQIGQIVFDDANNATLTTEGTGPEVERLRQVWAETSQLNSLPLLWTDEKTVDGELVISRKSKDVSKSDEDYPHAVWSYLESKHGYLVDQKN
jgi:hypothetical protein